MTIRRAVPDEGAALRVLIDAAYQAYRDAGIQLPDVTDGLEDEIVAGRVWVAELENGVGGVLNLSVEPPNAHLINVAVAPLARGQGVGGALIRFAIDMARASGCDALNLATHSDLADNIALYQHLGWQVVEAGAGKTLMTLTL
ncbi:GNAT family N-acetyltransferase [Shimia biformata]|uniref:GNAT family N-acetyltransferase n=1 Tax=Shimia biformata TaxID=1294299 RepID=UPI001951ED26|nr:GNAT family N-acetyltransferase [Shimia biformata]